MFSFLKKNVIHVVILLAAFFAMSVTSQAQSTIPCYDLSNLPSNQNSLAIIINIISLETQGAVVTCTNNNMFVNFPNGTFFSMNFPTGASIWMYGFNPQTGRSVYIYLLGNGNLMIQDSSLGTIYTGSGWYNQIFYPLGNPFDASVQNPMQLMFQQHLPPGIIELLEGWERGPRYDPYQP